jgi:FKBP-type peptidyl-prolyl cis-trans isomerase FkpA
MLQKTGFLCITTVCAMLATAQQTKPVTPLVKVNPPQTLPAAPIFSYKKLNPQLQYAFIIDKPTATKPVEGDQVSIHMQSVCNNRIMYSTVQAFKGKPGVYGVSKPAYKGDLIEAIMLMTPGDSIVCLADAEVIFKNAKNKMPDYIKPGDKIQYFVKLVSIKSKVQVQKEQQAAFQKQMNEQMAKQKIEAAKLVAKDDKTLNNWFAKNKVTPTKTTSGMYYTIKEEGSGDKALAGDTVVMNYTGHLLDGTTFDSNEDTAFHHVQPFQFVLGRGAVIRGWDEGVALLKKGSKAVFYIPSGMAYGAQARPGSEANPKGIPANSILLFDVQLVNVTHPVPPLPAATKDSMMAPGTIKMEPIMAPATKDTLQKN